MDIIKGMTDCSPAETGYDESRLGKLNERLMSMVERNVIHGACYCISHKGKIIANASLGRNNKLGTDTPMQPDTIFGIASITKTFTAAAVMQLTEDGILNLNDTVGQYLPQFAEPPFSDIKLIHLLTHTSGLCPDGGCFSEASPASAWELIGQAYKAWDKQGEFDWIKAGISAGLRRPVGTEWMYSSFLFCVLGEIISRVSGMNAHEYIEKNILRPLKMNDSFFDLTPETAKRAFICDEEDKEHIENVISGKAPEITDEQKMWDSIPSTGGGLSSTVRDLVRFGNAFVFGGRLDGARILGRKSVEKMSKAQLLPGVPDFCWGAKEPNRQYGIGFDIRRTPSFSYSDNTIMHEGSGASSIDIDLDEQLVAAWFVPFGEGAGGWSAEPLYNVQNIIWSGLI